MANGSISTQISNEDEIRFLDKPFFSLVKKASFGLRKAGCFPAIDMVKIPFLQSGDRAS